MKFASGTGMRQFCIVLMAVCFVGPVAVAEESSGGDRAAARSAVGQFGTTLKAALGAAMAKGDLVAALDVCTDDAPHIAADVTEQAGIAVARTSEKLRNPANRPSDWQLAVLREWQADMASGIDISGREYFSAQSDGGFRYMSPIFVKPPCLTCHGESLSAELQAALDARYPADQATGYRVGDLRGAFIAQK